MRLSATAAKVIHTAVHKHFGELDRRNKIN